LKIISDSGLVRCAFTIKDLENAINSNRRTVKPPCNNPSGRSIHEVRIKYARRERMPIGTSRKT